MDTVRMRRIASVGLLCLLMVIGSAGGTVAADEPEQRQDSLRVQQGDYIYTTAYDDTVKKIPADGGSAVWSYSLPSDGGGIAVDDNGDVYVGDSADNTHKIDGDTGENIWTYSGHGAGVRGVAVDNDGNVYTTENNFFNENPTVRKLDASTGSMVWGYEGHGTAWVQEITVGPDGYLYTASDDADGGGTGGSLHKIDPDTANMVWNYSDPSPIETVTTNADGVFIGTQGNDVHRIDPSDGTQVWTYTGHTNAVEGIATDSGGGVYSGGMDGETHKIAADTGTAEWVYTGHTDGVRTTAVGTNGDVYAGGASSDLHAIDATDGSQIWVNGDHSDQIMDITTLYSSDPTPPTPTPEPTATENESLTIDTRLYLEHDQTAPFSVLFESPNNDGRLTREDVTNDSTITVGDTDVVTVDQTAGEITATDNTSINRRTYVEANYTTDGVTYTTRQNVTVANATVDNLKILPTWTKTSASIGDKTIQAIIVATIIAAATAIAAGSFAGIAAHTIIMVAGWLMGYVGNGMVIVSFLFAIFVGLNVATNFQPIMQPRG